jgi:hypothetical protein
LVEDLGVTGLESIQVKLHDHSLVFGGQRCCLSIFLAAAPAYRLVQFAGSGA